MHRNFSAFVVLLLLFVSLSGCSRRGNYTHPDDFLLDSITRAMNKARDVNLDTLLQSYLKISGDSSDLRWARVQAGLPRPSILYVRNVYEDAILEKCDRHLEEALLPIIYRVFLHTRAEQLSVLGECRRSNRAEYVLPPLTVTRQQAISAGRDWGIDSLEEIQDGHEFWSSTFTSVANSSADGLFRSLRRAAKDSVMRKEPVPHGMRE